MTEVVTAASQAAGGEADRSYVYRCDPGPAGLAISGVRPH